MHSVLAKAQVQMMCCSMGVLRVDRSACTDNIVHGQQFPATCVVLNVNLMLTYLTQKRKQRNAKKE